jgi:predicted amidohydrolase
MKAKVSSSTINLGLLQMKVGPKPDENLKRTVRAAEDAAKKGAQIICTQELFRSYYFCQNEDHENFTRISNWQNRFRDRAQTRFRRLRRSIMS